MSDDTNTITTTVTFDDLSTAYDDELAELREAYEDVVAFAEEEFGPDAFDRPIPEDGDEGDREALATLKQQARVYEESGKSIQNRQHVLDSLKESYSGMDFTIKMLTGSELMDIETELRMEAQAKGVEVSTLQATRKQLTVDAATVDAPPEVPRDDDGNPTPSECPNPLTFALHDQIERLNTSGATDFRAPGFGDETDGLPASSGPPTRAGEASSDLDPTDGSTPPRGDTS